MADTKSSPIFKRGTDGKVRQWQYEIDDGKYRIIHGIRGGNLVTSEWTKAKPKNVGKANQTTPDQQAILEAEAEEAKKLKREYRRTIPELDFVPDGPMLAADYAKLKKPLDFKQPIYSQPKYDGIRALMSYKTGATTRELQPHLNCSHLLARLAPLFAKYPNIQFDGELYNHEYKDDFNEITRLVRKEKLSDEQRKTVREKLKFYVYDLPGPGVFSERTTMLQKLLRELDDPMIVYVPTSIVSGQDALDALYGAYMEDGYEGQMVRTNDLPYEFDSRSKSLLKRKEFVTEEFPIIDILEGEGNWSGMAKRIVFRHHDGGEGTAGMRGSMDFARELLANKQAYSQATIRYFGITPDGELRFPVAVDFQKGARVD